MRETKAHSRNQAYRRKFPPQKFGYWLPNCWEGAPSEPPCKAEFLHPTPTRALISDLRDGRKISFQSAVLLGEKKFLKV